MDNHTEALEQRLRGIEARVTVIEAESKKLDRLVYKLFKRLPCSTRLPPQYRARALVSATKDQFRGP